MYAKYVNEYTVEYFHGKALDLGDRVIANPSEEHLLAAGYKPLVEITPTDCDGILLRRYSDAGDFIKVDFEEVKIGGEGR